MDDKTVNFYNHNASYLTERYNSVESPYAALFPVLFKEGDRILDIGCGSGRDLGILLERGCDAYGMEPSDSLWGEAVKCQPLLQDRIFKGALPLEESPFADPFDHILLSAVIMHIPDNELFESVYSLRSLLKEGGLAIISHCPIKDVPLIDDRDEEGRLFILRSSEQIQLLFEELGFRLKDLYHTEDKLRRAGISWDTLVFEFRGETCSDSVDRIESIINNDRKTATYKLALLRALCEIAQKDPHQAHWTSKGRVKVPLEAISNKWIEYYLPMMGHDTFVPNNRGERSDSNKPVAFRNLLSDLGAYYPSTPQGLAQFLDDRDRNRFSAEREILYREAVKKIGNTIKKGPITYTSGETFFYDPADKTVIMEGGLWRELVLLGHWIGDSLILKWAQLIHGFSLSTIEFPMNQALSLLLMEPESERRMGPARRTYEAQSDLVCVWSEKELTKKNLAIDHAIPFSIRHDNSLWNLLPSDRKVNLDKSDKLPSHGLIQKRRSAIIYNWQLLYKSDEKDLFTSESCRFLGVPELSVKSWEIDLFNRFFETVEMTASRRGIERWEG
ncbi:MAG: methyltransferase domain-containing protein [Spirochaetales bacterium]|nr:methyltransferase domain-containing protein [Spirochaetales bacterium]